MLLAYYLSRDNDYLSRDNVYEKIIVKCDNPNISSYIWTKFHTKSEKNQSEIFHFLNGLLEIQAKNCKTELKISTRVEDRFYSCDNEYCSDSDTCSGNYSLDFKTFELKIS
ncbi:unnamed protein product [Brachionus calyciflorus]|uniref:Uncharacterized protein n=1 Tax=Brachionus calyciflorus TaxID=104777 RepID=A0A813QZC3_9BILA|nr:unnamed protein product [Brachionus calyciflorus]